MKCAWSEIHVQSHVRMVYHLYQSDSRYDFNKSLTSLIQEYKLRVVAYILIFYSDSPFDCDLLLN